MVQSTTTSKALTPSRITRVCAGFLSISGVLIAIAGLGVFASSQTGSLILIGHVSPLVMGPLIVVLGAVVVACGVTTMSSDGMPLKPILITAAIAASGILVIYGFSGSIAYVEVAKDSTGRAYLVEEEGSGLGSSARLLELNGIVAHSLAPLATNNGVRAFAAGNYTAELAPQGLVLSYQVGSSTDWATATFPLTDPR